MVIPGLIGAGASIAGGIIAADEAKAAAKQNYEAQKEFAKHGIRWKVDDAAKRGIHPLYALGAPTSSFSPSFIGGGDYGVSNMGQDLSRAAQQTMTHEERLVTKTAMELDLQHKKLENDLLGWQVIDARNQALAPATPGSVGIFTPTPVSGLSKAKMPYGWMLVLSKDIAESLESDPAQVAAHVAKIRALDDREINRIMKTLPPVAQEYPGAQRWFYDRVSSSFVPYYPDTTPGGGKLPPPPPDLRKLNPSLPAGVQIYPQSSY